MASKKSFKADINPAMQFISQPEEAPQEETSVAAPAKAGKAPAGYKLNPLYVETKSRRLQLLVQPSMHDRLKERAAREGKSINELVNSFLEDGLREE
jgi:hypothetical protein